MDSYLLDVMCASREDPSLGWKWNLDLPSIHVYYKMLQENKYKEDYERMCNGSFALVYQILFGEEAPCLSLKGENILQACGDWYRTSDEVYIRALGSTKDMHQFPHFVLDTLLTQDISYQNYANGVVASLHKSKRLFCLIFPYPGQRRSQYSILLQDQRG